MSEPNPLGDLGHFGESIAVIPPERCAGGTTSDIYHGLASGLCPSCGEFVALVSTGQTVRHFKVES